MIGYTFSEDLENLIRSLHEDCSAGILSGTDSFLGFCYGYLARCEYPESELLITLLHIIFTGRV